MRCLRAPLAALSCLAFAPASLAQPYWARTHGGPGTGEHVHAVREMPNGDLVIAATTDSFGTTTGDAWLLRLDPAGFVLSQALVGNALPGGVDGAVVLADGGAVFASRNVRDLFTAHDAWIVRVAADGSPLWVTEISSPADGLFFVNDVVALRDGTFLGVGQASVTDAGPHLGWLVLLDASGSVLWQQYHGGPTALSNWNLGFEAGIQTDDGGFAVTGWISGGGPDDVYIAKTNASGAITWNNRVAGTQAERGMAICQARFGGGFAVAGWTDSFTTSGHSGWIIRMDSVGALTWTEAIGSFEWSELHGIIQTADQDFVMVGRVGFATNDLWVAKIMQGVATITWQRRFEGPSGDFGNEIAELANGDLLLGGTWAWGFPQEDAWLLRTDPDGVIPACGLTQPTTLTWSAPRYTRTQPTIPPYPPFGVPGVGSVVTAVPSGDTNLQCGAGACPILRCDAIEIDPNPTCEGTMQVLSLSTAGGTPPLDVRWDLDGDTTPEIAGNPVNSTFPLGTTAVRAVVTDSCAPIPSTCELTADVVVTSATVTCDAIAIDPNPACEGTERLLTLSATGGTPPLDVQWDLDGDTTPDATGNPVTSTFPPGTTTVRAVVHDGCVPVPSTCELTADVVALPATPPAEVSDVRAGAVPLLVKDHGARLSFEDRPDAVAYNLHADAIGSWYFPNVPSGSRCFIATMPGGAGRLEAAPSLAVNTWVVVTATNDCTEGSPGRDSFLRERRITGTWPTCAPPP